MPQIESQKIVSFLSDLFTVLFDNDKNIEYASLIVLVTKP